MQIEVGSIWHCTSEGLARDGACITNGDKVLVEKIGSDPGWLNIIYFMNLKGDQFYLNESNFRRIFTLRD